MNLSEVLILKFPDIDFISQVIIQDDGQGPYIKKWDESLGPKPDQVILDQWALEVAPVKALQDARQNRREEYSPMGDQNDAILKQFKLMEQNGIEILPELKAIMNHHDNVKAKYPIQGE